MYHPWKKEEAGNQTREIMYTISLSNPLAPKTATVTETQVKPSLLIYEEKCPLCPTYRGLFVYLSTNKVKHFPSYRHCTRPARRVSVTSSTPRSSHMTCPTMITSTPSTATCSPGWPRTSVVYGEQEWSDTPTNLFYFVLFLAVWGNFANGRSNALLHLIVKSIHQYL